MGTLLIQIFSKMGLITYNGDVQAWAHTMNQGMNSFEAMENPDKSAPNAQLLIDGRHAFYQA